MKLKRIKRGIVVCLAMVLTVSALMVPAFAGIIDWYLVDSGKHLDYGGTTKYMSYVDWSASLWNGYKPGVIRKDTLTTLQDVTIADINYPTEFVGMTSKNGTILLNDLYLKGYGTNDIRQVTAHELGHALGLGDTTWPSDVMCGTKQDFAVIVLSRNDEESYDASYARYK